MPRRTPPRLTRPVDFDPSDDLGRIARFALAWRGQFRPAKVSHAPSYFLEELKALEEARALRLYLVTRPSRPLPLAILDGFDQREVLMLLALASSEPGDVRPFLLGPGQRRRLMGSAPAEPSGRGVFAFLLGEQAGLAWLDMEPEGLVLALARWGGLNVLDPAPLIAGRLRLLGQRVRQMASPEDQGP